MICETFINLAAQTWALIEQSRAAGMPLKEETITDLNMLQLKLALPQQVVVHVFNRRSEATTGADWEWWFHQQGRWLGFRVQAKILDIRTEAFEHLHYRSGTPPVFQSDKLIHDAANGIAKIPLYCLYSQSPDPTRLNNWSCRTFQNHKNLFGCALLGAHLVRQLRTDNRLDQLDKYFKPWHCLVCCKGFSGQTAIEQIEAYAKALFIQTIAQLDSPGTIFPDSYIVDKPPAYVSTVFRQNSNEILELEEKNLAGVLLLGID